MSRKNCKIKAEVKPLHSPKKLSNVLAHCGQKGCCHRAPITTPSEREIREHWKPLPTNFSFYLDVLTTMEETITLI